MGNCATKDKARNPDTGSGGREGGLGRADRIRGSDKENALRNGKAAQPPPNGHHRSVMNNYHGHSPSHVLAQNAVNNGAGGGVATGTGGSGRGTIRGQMVVALYTYQGSECGDMSFNKGDVMEIIDDSDPDWWVAIHLESGAKGHIPRNYVAFQSSIESQEWFFGQISRREAEEYLMAHINARGTFLIRESEQNPGGFALSIKDYDQERTYHVKHYKIKPLDNNRGYYITTRQTFNSLPDLVAGYQSALCKGLCCQLTKPCPKTQPREARGNALEYATRDQYEIPRSQITLIKKLGAGNFGEVWKGTWQGRVEVAVKTLKPNTMSPEAFLQEAEIMKKFSHPHLVAMYAVCTDQEPFYIITEFMINGALLDFLRKDESKMKLSFDSLISIAAQRDVFNLPMR